ncbi:MAG: DUF4249 domain-containing protein [Saprospiraceae bacterium]
MNHFLTRFLLPLALLSLFLFACEQEFLPVVEVQPAQIVVEGYIEGGDRPSTPYVFLTRSVAFFTAEEQNDLSDFYVHNARITVSDGSREVVLTEICSQSLDSTQLALAAAFLGFDPANLEFNLCVYIDPSFSLYGEIGKTYFLDVTAEGNHLTAQTSLPELVVLDSVYFIDPPGTIGDSLAQLQVILPDPPGIANFYRYFTSTNGGTLRRSDFSVVDDRLFDGQTFILPLNEAEADSVSFDLSTYGLFRRGDAMTLKFVGIDEAHYQFWNTLEFSASNQGPFSNITRVRGNIEGGLGIWGGLSATYYERAVE